MSSNITSHNIYVYSICSHTIAYTETVFFFFFLVEGFIMANGHITKLCPISPFIDLEIPEGGNVFMHEHGLSHKQRETQDTFSHFY